MLQRARAPGTPADGSADGAATMAAMAMRGKRQRAAAATAFAADEEPLLAVDPSLMTERQQLAFLLRATAHEASASDSPGSDDGGSGDERRAGAGHAHAHAHPRKKPRRPAADAQPRGRGRPPRRPARPARASPRTPRARVAAPTADGENDAGAGNASLRPMADARRAGDRGGHDLRRAKKPPSAGPPPPALRRPASSSAASFAAEGPTCALCGHGAPVGDALFLCPACDRKYPTQQALGRMCMT